MAVPTTFVETILQLKILLSGTQEFADICRARTNSQIDTHPACKEYNAAIENVVNTQSELITQILQGVAGLALENGKERFEDIISALAKE